MERAVIETLAGFVGLSWSRFGLVALNLPTSCLIDAETELQAVLEGLKVRSQSDCQAPLADFDLAKLEKKLNEYFHGKRVDFSLPVDFRHYTDFQKTILKRVQEVSWGQMVSYGQIAAQAGIPRGSRAVGGAVGVNRILLVIPCHRVIAHNGTLGGFGYGLEWKRKLLKLEGISL